MTMEHLPDIPRSLTALAEWLSCAIIIFQTTKTMRKKIVFLTLPLMGIGQLLLQLWVDSWPLTLWILGMLVNFGWMYLTLIVCTKHGFLSNTYLVCKSFIFAELIASLAWQIYSFFILPRFPDNLIIQSLTMLGLYLLFIGIYILFNRKHTLEFILKDLRHRDIFISLLTALIIFSVSNLGFLLSQTNYPLGDGFTIFTFRALINLAGLLILFIQENTRSEVYLRDELKAINHVLQSQYEQYESYRESNQLIHQKFHDLKHQIDIIQMEVDSEKQKDYIEQLKKDIRLYQSPIKTGNAIMDTILTRKNMFCMQNKITLTSIADGKLLDFIEVMDLSSLIGNSLDNAIESVMLQKEPEKRLIQLQVVKKNQFVLFQLKNYSEKTLNFNDGLPVTTKKNTEKHGYGLKSISYIVTKYQGTLSITHQDNWFVLTILFPIANT